MKSLIGLLFTLIASTSFALELNCMATEVSDTSYLEESFTVEEYPEVGVSETMVTLGSALFDLERGDEITMLPSVGFEKTVQVKQADNGPTYIVHVNMTPNNKTGIVTAQNPDEAQANEIAKITCE